MHKKLQLISVIFLFVCSLVHAADWMPDARLEQAVRDKLQISDAIPIHKADMPHLHEIITDNISNLQGLEHAINLKVLLLNNGGIRDLTPLSHLTQLYHLELDGNQIVDISPLSHLTQLEDLALSGNQITDFTPLLNLTNLKYLDIRDNPDSGAGQFVSAHPAIIDALRRWMCDFERPSYVRPVSERIEDRDYPSIYVHTTQSFKNTSDLESMKHLARSDMFGEAYPFGNDALWFEKSPFGGVVRAGEGLRHIQNVKRIHEELLHENPNMMFFVEIAYFDGRGYHDDRSPFGLDSPYWLRNPDGTIAHRPAPLDAQGNEKWVEPLLDFTNPDVIDIIVAQAVAVAKCGLYDGIWLDRWQETTDFQGELRGLVTPEAERLARDKILQRIRASVPDDFLIFVNATWSKIPRWASYINGVLMETWPSGANDTYTHRDFSEFEEAILWNEANLKDPSLALLHCKLEEDTDRNQQTVRAFTTLSLTHSDGYINVHLWNHGDIYDDFFDAPLGRPIGEKTKTYDNREGLFIREFTNGWAVYNRSGNEQTITLEVPTTAFSRQTTDTQHTIPDLDGEIYLKQRANADVNGDSVVNVLDLVLVANAFGKKEPDLNGDGIVNVLDLVIVATEF